LDLPDAPVSGARPIAREETSHMTLEGKPSTAPQMDPALRLDKLPLSQFHRKLVLVSGVGWMFDSMDVGIISFVVATLAREW
jgi:hypothetical protein